MKNPKRAKPAMASTVLSEAEWKAYGRGEEMPARVGIVRRDRFESLTRKFNIDLDTLNLSGDVAGRILSHILMLPEARWQRFLHLLCPAGNGQPRAVGVQVNLSPGRKPAFPPAVLRRAEAALAALPPGTGVRETLTRELGQSATAERVEALRRALREAAPRQKSTRK